MVAKLSTASVAVAIRIDPEFEAICRPLTDEEFAALRADIAAHGCLDPLIVWRENGILLDGHHRFALCRELDLPFKVTQLGFPSRSAAWKWVIDHQIGRRNLGPLEMAYSRGKQHLLERRDVAGTQFRPGSNRPIRQIEGARGETAQRIARHEGVSRATVERDAQFAGWVDRVCDGLGPAGRRLVLSGALRLRRSDLRELAARESPPATLDELRAAAAASAEKLRVRRPRPDALARFFQRSIKTGSIETYTDPDDGTEYFDKAQLSCGHEYRWKRRVEVGTTRVKSAPCVTCGSSTRRGAENARILARFERSLKDPVRREHLAQWIELTIEWLLLPDAGPPRLDRIRSRMRRAFTRLEFADFSRDG